MTGTFADDIDEKAFATYFKRRYGQTSEVAGQPLSQLLQNLGLSDGHELNLAGLMLFGKRPQRYRPAFEVKAVAFPGLVLHDTRYLDSEDIDGTLLEQYQRSFAFIKRNLRHIQTDRGFNTLGELEIPEQALEELLVNALIHRDYFTSASIRLMVFADRVEIISPGHLPDSLSTEAIRHICDLLMVIQDGQTRTELMHALGLKDRKHFRITYLQPALDAGLLGMSMPDKPSSRLQKYRISEQGKALPGQITKNKEQEFKFRHN